MMTANKQYRRERRYRFGWLLGGFSLIVWSSFAGQLAKAVSEPFQSVQVSTPSELNREATFWYRVPLSGAPVSILLLVPGCNGDGRGMLNETGPWAQFADEAHLVLVAPTFKTTMEEVHSRKGYYYPELWSGEATLKALEQIRMQTGVQSDKLLIFGFSAGAHFAHRFALWRPGKVTAFVAYSAGWWDAPKQTLHRTPGLIMCGEADERFGPTYAFFSEGRRLRLPLIWRGYMGVGHELKPQIVKMAQTFLKFYISGQKSSPVVGDLQAYRFYEPGSPEVARIPMESLVELPSREVAEVWQQED